MIPFQYPIIFRKLATKKPMESSDCSASECTSHSSEEESGEVDSEDNNSPKLENIRNLDVRKNEKQSSLEGKEEQKSTRIIIIYFRMFM